MVTKKIMDKPSNVDLTQIKPSVVKGEKLFDMLCDTVYYYESSPDIPKNEIKFQKQYLVYMSYGNSASAFFQKEHYVIHYVEEIVPALTKEEKEKWENVRNEAAISMMNALLETTQHSVVLEPAANSIYARVAVAYADSLIKELRNNEDWVEKILEL